MMQGPPVSAVEEAERGVSGAGTVFARTALRSNPGCLCDRDFQSWSCWTSRPAAGTQAGADTDPLRALARLLRWDIARTTFRRQRLSRAQSAGGKGRRPNRGHHTATTRRPADNQLRFFKPSTMGNSACWQAAIASRRIEGSAPGQPVWSSSAWVLVR